MPAYSNDIRCTLSVDGDDGLFVVGVLGEEALSSLYLFRCTLYAERPVDAASRLGLDATLTLRDYGGGTHRWHGVVAGFAELERTPTGHLYSLELRPHAWWLTLTEYSQVFLDADQSDANPGAPLRDILEKAARQGGLPAPNATFRGMDATFRRRYVCQYEESFYAFCARWLEFLGAPFFFDHDGRTDVLTVDEAASSGDVGPIPYSEAFGLEPRRDGVVHAFSPRLSVPPTRVLVRDYNPERPDEAVIGTAQGDPQGIGECYLYGEYVKTADEAARIAAIRSEAFLCRKRIYEGAGTVPGLRPGRTFTLRGHPDQACNAAFRVESVRHEIDQSGRLMQLLKADLGSRAGAGKGLYASRFVCLDAGLRYRPRQVAPWPRIAKVISAHVETQGGKDYAQLDAQGRYRVRLPFDVSDSPDGRASCLLHMGTPYAGNGFGMHFPLPAGTEVMLGFVGGHPDRPYISAAIPNPATPSPRSEQTQTSLVITSLKRNVIEVEDRKGSEHLLLSSAPTGARVQYGSTPAGGTACGGRGVYENTGGGGTYVLSVGGHAEQNTSGRHREDINAGDFVLNIAGNRDERVQGFFEETAGGAVAHQVALDDYENCVGNRTVDCGATLRSETETGYGSETVGGDKKATLAEYFSGGAATFITLKTAANAHFFQKDLSLTSPKITLTADGKLTKTTETLVIDGPSASWFSSAGFNANFNGLKYSQGGKTKDDTITASVSVTLAAASSEMTSLSINALRVAIAAVKRDTDLFKGEVCMFKGKVSTEGKKTGVALLELYGFASK